MHYCRLYADTIIHLAKHITIIMNVRYRCLQSHRLHVVMPTTNSICGHQHCAIQTMHEYSVVQYSFACHSESVVVM